MANPNTRIDMISYKKLKAQNQHLVNLVAALLQAVGGEIRVSDRVFAASKTADVKISRSEETLITVYKL